MVKARGTVPNRKAEAGKKAKIVPMSLTPDALADLDAVAQSLADRGLVAQPFKSKPNRSGTVAYLARKAAGRLTR